MLAAARRQRCVRYTDKRSWRTSEAERLAGVESDDRKRSTRQRSHSSIDSHQKSGTIALGMGRADVPGKKELGLSAQLISRSGPSGALANCTRRSIGTFATAASYCLKRWMASQGIVKAPGSST